MSGKLYVGNLRETTTSEELQRLFSAAGPVKWADVATDPRTGRCKGFGFVQMATLDAARRAVAALNARAHGGAFLEVAESRPKGAAAPTKQPRPRPRSGSSFGARRGYRAPRV